MFVCSPLVGGYPIPGPGAGGGDVPHPAEGGIPNPRSGQWEVPHPADGGGTPSQVWMGGPIPGLDGSVPHPVDQGVPHPRSGWGVPKSSWLGTPSQVWTGGHHPRSEWGCTPSSWPGGTSSQVWMGVTPSQVWMGRYAGLTLLARTGLGTLPDLGWGTPPWPGLDGLPPPPPFRQSSIASTSYAAGGMPLAFTQEDFLVVNMRSWRLETIKIQSKKRYVIACVALDFAWCDVVTLGNLIFRIQYNTSETLDPAIYA